METEKTQNYDLQSHGNTCDSGINLQETNIIEMQTNIIDNKGLVKIDNILENVLATSFTQEADTNIIENEIY
jgi:hypothetical protein